MSSVSGSRNISLDLLKFTMALMVVGVHGNVLLDINSSVSYVLINGLFRMAVPTFFIINGFYFYQTIKKRQVTAWFKRVLILYVFWMMIYSYFWLPNFSIKTIRTMIEGYEHLWYIQSMIGAALLLLILRIYDTKLIILITLSTFLAGVGLQYIAYFHLLGDNILDEKLNYVPIYRNFLLTGFPYFSIGYLIHRYKIYKQTPLSVLAPIVLVGGLLLMNETYFNLISTPRRSGFDNLFSLIIFAPAIFLLFIQLNIRGNSKNIALCSSSVYFTHLFILQILKTHTTITPTMLTGIVTAMAILLSIPLIQINRRTKFFL